MAGDIGWSAWRLDPATWGWIVWLVFGVAWESYWLAQGYRGSLTAHLRPIFLSWPVTWWLALGLYGWLGIHLLAPSLERALLEMARG